MRKKRMQISPSHREGCRKFLLGLLQLMLLLLVFNLNLSASAFSQYQKISVTLKNAGIEEFIEAIKKQCDVGFIYDYNKAREINNITVEAENEELHAVLDKALKGTGFMAEIVNRTIILRKATLPQNAGEGQVIRGKVQTKQGELLPGVTILIKGTSLGAVTDAKGMFELTIPEPVGKVLVFSFVGMETQEVTVKDSEPLNVTLHETVSEMDEVVVTGIYSRKKESFTGSSTTYSSKELKMIGNQNILQSLKTLDPSFAILENNQFGSDPNRLPDINVRGKTSVIGLTQEYGTDPNQPLFILDGFEATLASISDLSMDRVASITVLKDAAATAIYGSKAANGVVVVETKAPEAGKLRVNYSGNLNLSFADLSDYNLMNSSEKLEFERISGYYGELDAEGNIINEGDSQLFYQRLAEVKRGVDTYWMSEPLRFATTHSHNLFIEGGDEKVRYGLGVSYGKTQGVMKDSDRDVLNGNFRLIYRYKTLAFTNYMNVDYSRSSREKVAFSQFSRANPYHRKLNEYGEAQQIMETYTDSDINSSTFARTLYVYNPLYDMLLNNSDITKTFGFRNNFETEWKIKPELRAKGRVSVTKSASRGEVFKSPKNSSFEGVLDTEKGTYSESNTDALSYDADLNLTYVKLFNEKHMVNAVGGFRVQSNQSKASGFVARGFIDDRYSNPSFSQGYPEGGKPSYSNTEKRSASYYINAGYAFDNRYLLDANFRSDGSSVFGSSKKFTTTWAVGLGWNMHNESFIKDNITWLDMLKFRFSVGNPGNQNFDAYIAMNVYGYSTSYPNPFGLSAVINSWGNKNLEWQKTIDKNFGVDFGVWNNRLKFTIEYFTKNTDPLLVYVTLPSSSGTSSAPMNLGKQMTKGITGTLNFTMLQKENLHWAINMNARHISYEYRNIGNALERYNKENRSSNLVRYYDGGSPSDIWAVRSAGIDPATGREIFIKKDGSQTFVHDYADEVVVGNTDPKLEGVVGTSFYYKGFSASVNLRYRVGGQIFLQTLYEKVENISENALRYNQDKRALYDRWQKPGDVSKFKGISLTDSSTPMSSRFVADENTLSGESISVGYETQGKWLRYIGASSMTVQAYMNDIFRISTVKNERGLDYPFARSVAFSLSVRF